MPIPDEAFRHAPELRGRIAQPEASRFRDMHARYAEFDASAEAEGRDPGWRIPDAEREATRREALRGRHGADLWIFAYGSLIWDPAMEVAEIRRACLRDWRRSFCLHLEGGRGTPECPGLMAALDADPGHACEGVALRVPADKLEAETERLWMREMITGIYLPRFVPLETCQGPVQALAFLSNPEHPRHVGDMPRAERAARIAVAAGPLGSNLEYLENLLEHLGALGMHDPEMTELHRMTLAQRSAG